MMDVMNDTTSALLSTIRQLAAELHTRPEKAIQITLDSSLERDLGFDSLGRVEPVSYTHLTLPTNREV